MENVPFYLHLEREMSKIRRSADVIDRFSKLYQNKLNNVGELTQIELNSLFLLLQKECRKLEAIQTYQNLKQGA